MSIEISTVGILFLGIGLVILTLLHKPLTRPETPGSTAFVITVIGCALWPLSLSVELFTGSNTAAVLAWSGRLIAPTVLSVGWFLLAVRIANGRQPAQWLVGLLVGYVVVELLVLTTNPVHHLAFDPAVVGSATEGTRDWNAWFWVQATLNYVLMGYATFLFAAEAIRETGLRRRQSALLAVAVLPTGVANLITISGAVTVSTDLSPFGLMGGVIIMSVALYRAEFLDLVPIARKTALEKLPDAVVTLDRNGRVVDYNAVARTYFNAESGIGVSARTFFAGVPAETVDALEAGAVNHLQFSIQTDDEKRYFDGTASPLGPPEEDAGRVIVLREVTDRIRREQRLHEQNETLSEFANIVSHDIQGPLMELRSTATTAVETGDIGRVDGVLDAADRMDRLVDDLLALAQSGRQIDDPTPVPIRTIAERAWDSVWTPSAELSIETDRTIEADPDRLQQLLENCFRNAVEHGSGVSLDPQNVGDGPASLGTTPGSDDGISVVLRSIPGGFAIDDDGAGIPPKRRDAIFERGYTSSLDGTGLGLAIVRQIAVAHGWSITAEDSPTGGARFALTGVTICEKQADSTRTV